jgi:NADP-dependent 3-hydroxy acid dehydrogenase YdfG
VLAVSESGAARAIVITEAASPVALAAAARLAARGDLVVMGSRRPEICERLAERLRSDGAAAFAAYLDLTDPPSIDRFVTNADYLIGLADVLITAAGVADGSRMGAQHLAAQVIPPMIEHGHGDVVLISPALVGTSFEMTDHILEAWAAGLDAEFVGSGVRASIIRSTGMARPADVGRLIAAAISTHLAVVDIIPSRLESAASDGVTREMRC